jgi:sterol desaturase/sphingolipid hydroxylase (fatty acid hydroxylase superfamily)
VAWLSRAVEVAYWYVAVSVFLALAATESIRPANPPGTPLAGRWLGNFALYAACLGVAALIASLQSVSGFVDNESPRLLFAELAWLGGNCAVLAGGVLLADLLIYVLHRLEHRVFLLWRFHAVHHADMDVDASTGLRHHPGEFAWNSFIMVVVLSGTGAPAWLIPVYGLLFMVASLFQHMNAALAPGVDRLLRLVLVTPGMHRIHHSVPPEHHDTNFGSVFSWWDRLFATYRDPERIAQRGLTFGVEPFLGRRFAGFHWPWIMPFVMRREATAHGADG